MPGIRIATQQLSFAYRRGAPFVLADFDLELEPGSLTVLTGASGAGKSTLLYLLALLLPDTSGTITWNGVPVARISDGERSRLRAAHSGFIFQDAMLDPSRSVLDNVLESALFSGINPATAEKRALSLLDEFGIAHRTDHRPGEISGGQAQRVALCRALVTNPDVVFGDEPTGNLDTNSAVIVWDALVSHAAQGATVVVATHDQSLAQAADQTIVIDLPDDSSGVAGELTRVDGQVIGT